jgi:hypothetical protein
LKERHGYTTAFYAPAVRTAKPGDLLWELRREHITWSAELRFHGESWGWEAQILRDDDLLLGQRFLSREQATRFAEAIQAEIQPDRWPTVDDISGETKNS